MPKAIKLTFSEAEFVSLVVLFERRAFSTFDFAKLIQSQSPTVWKSFLAEYGEGGKGAGRHYSAYSRVSRVLFYWANRGIVHQLVSRKAPKAINWGNPVIGIWAQDKNNVRGPLIAEEVLPSSKTYEEGGVTTIQVNVYERDPAARRACIAHYGAACAVCHFDFGKRYGERGEGYIHVHHKTALFKSSGRKKTDPIKDLVPVCPNCHAMLHAVQDGLTVEKLRGLLRP